jgi:hypothetical protein
MAGKWARYVAAFIAASGLFTVIACSGRTGTSTGTSFCASSAAKLRSCGLLSPGVLRCEEPQDAEEQCIINCLNRASCADLRTVVCPTTAGPSSALLDCASNCVPTEFRCADGTTLDASSRCDGFPECSDGSDEAGCPTVACGDGTTVPESFQCDGYADCSNGSDESACPTFACANGETVPVEWKCDGAPDCSDGSDEAGCPEFAEFTCSGA